MEAQIVTIFCVIDDILKSIGFRDDIQTKMSASEVLTTVVTASMFFGGNQEKARIFLQEHGYIKNMLSKSQLNRRLHRIDVSVWEYIQNTLSYVFKQRNSENRYSVDSFPIEVCHNIRISRCKIYTEEEYRGKCASKHEYFYGIRVLMIVTETGEPIEYCLAPGSHHDNNIFKRLELDLPEGSSLYGDAAFIDYQQEDDLKQDLDLNFFVARKENSKRPHSPSVAYLLNHYRKIVETSFASIIRLFPRKIHAVTSRGFELKICSFILAYSFNCL